MNKRELFDIQTLTFADCARILHSKNQDYAGDNDDALANFKTVQILGITSPTQGVLVRLTDKFMRIVNVLKAGQAAVKTETVEDTINDAINYLVILKSIVREEHSRSGGLGVSADAEQQVRQSDILNSPDEGAA